MVNPRGHSVDVHEAMMHLQKDFIVEKPDVELLRQCAQGKNEWAFREIVQRHATWVYAVAFRQLKNAQAAEDATQAVFVLLWRKVGRLNGANLGGWLFVATNYTVRAMKRAELRRRKHERKAAMHHEQHSVRISPEPGLAGELDAAVHRLGVKDRAAIVLRFYQGLAFAQVAAALGVSEQAARKRVNRAVEKLRGELGLSVSAASVFEATAHGAPLSPASLCAQVNHAALAPAGAPVAIGAIAERTIFLMAITKAKLAVVTLVGLLLVAGSTGVAVWELRTRQRTTPALNAPVTAPVNATAEPTFEASYALQDDEVIRRILPPFSAARLNFYQSKMPRQVQSMLPTGPVGMLVRWSDGRPERFGRISDETEGYSLKVLVNLWLQTSSAEIEGDKDLIDMKLAGDFAFRGDATQDQIRGALERILSEEAKTKVALTYRDVDREVTVLQGQWHYTPVDARKEDTGPPTLELYGRDLNPRLHGGAGASANSLTGVAQGVTLWIGQQVFIEGAEMPENATWHANDAGDGSDASRLLAHDPGLVLQHLEEQTGLSAAKQMRNVRRLFIERAP